MGYENPVFTVHVDLGNDAFVEDTSGELGRILRSVHGQVMAGGDAGPCMDANGNRVGEWAIRSGRAPQPPVTIDEVVNLDVTAAAIELRTLFSKEIIDGWTDEMVGAAALTLYVRRRSEGGP